MQEILVQSTLFPPIQQISWMMRTKKVIIEQHDTYAKQTFRNRMQIVGPNGLQNLSIPVEKPFGSQTKMKDIRISESSSWQEQMFRSIRTAYKSTPFYEFYIDDYMPFFNQKHLKLIDLNMAVLKTVLEQLEITTQLALTTDYEKDPYSDLREIVHPKPQYKAKDGKYKDIPYHQLFEEKHGFIPNLSIIDLIFNEGPMSYFILKKTILGQNECE